MFVRRFIHEIGRSLREMGQQWDRAGLILQGNEIFRETFARHRQVVTLDDRAPIIGQCFIAPSATVIGHVLIGGDSSVWYGAVVRGDKNSVQIGNKTNIQDNAVLHCCLDVENGFPMRMRIGNSVTIGHGACLYSCEVGNLCLIGMNAVVLEGCVINPCSMVAAGSVVLPDTVIPPGQLWAGNPAKYIRDLSDEEKKSFEDTANNYSQLALEHSHEYSHFATTYQEGERVGILK